MKKDDMWYYSYNIYGKKSVIEKVQKAFQKIIDNNYRLLSDYNGSCGHARKITKGEEYTNNRIDTIERANKYSFELINKELSILKHDKRRKE